MVMDVANVCNVEFMCPSHPSAYFRAQNANEIQADGFELILKEHKKI